MKRSSDGEDNVEKTVTGGGYIYSENKHLETLVLRIRGGAPEGESAKKDFRKIFEVNAMVFIDRRLKKMFHRDMAGEDTQQMAYEVAEKLLQEVEKGNFDFCDDQGNILLNEKGEPRIRNLGGALWSKMNFIFLDLMKPRPIVKLDSVENETLPEQILIEHLGDSLTSTHDESQRRRLQEQIAHHRRILRGKNIAQQIIIWFKTLAEDQSKGPIEALLEKTETVVDKKKMVRDCFESLSLVQKNYISSVVSGLKQVDVSRLFGVSPAAVKQALNRARGAMANCLKGKGIETFTEIYGG